MKNAADGRALRLRAAFISDVHLGSRDCRADLLLEFLAAIEVDTLYLVGDIVDFWAMQKTVFWPQAHNNVVRTILGKAKAGTRVVYVPGNHDEFFREHVGGVFGNVQVHREYVHETAGGKRLLVLHGDEFDAAVKCSPWLERLGNTMYDITLELNRHVNGLRRLCGYPYWSLAGYLKHRVKNAMEHVARFEHAAAHAARRRGFDGIVCGHIHRPASVQLDGVAYYNDGDWVENCSALVEDMNGRLGLVRWPEFQLQLVVARTRDLAA